MRRQFALGALLCVAMFGVAALAIRGWADEPAKDAAADDAPARLEVAGVENLFRVSPRIYSGGEPHGEAGWTSLQELGVKTIISVDGAAPDAEAARRLGMRYVHLPIGYDQVPAERALQLVKAAQDLPGPIFIHCHHGKHRGPAAAAIAALGCEGWNPAQARAWLEEAGTSPNYAGLYRSVAEFQAPTAETLAAVPGEFPARAALPALPAAMAELERTWERLLACQTAGHRAPADEPDLSPAHEALQLRESFRELLRTPELPGGAEFLAEMKRSETLAAQLEAALRRSPVDQAAADTAISQLKASCVRCHTQHRDR